MSMHVFLHFSLLPPADPPIVVPAPGPAAPGRGPTPAAALQRVPPPVQLAAPAGESVVLSAEQSTGA